MSAGNWFWVLYVIVALFGGYSLYGMGDRRYFGGGIVVFVLIGLLGWSQFGPPLR